MSADLEAVAAWRAHAEEKAGIEPAPELDPIQDAEARQAAKRAGILGKGDVWVKQAVAYDREMGAASPKPDPAEATKRWRTARDSGIAGGTR